MIRLAVAGALGRVGRDALEHAAGDERFEIAAALTKPACSSSCSTIHFADRDITVSERLSAECDVLIDFTVADGTMAWLEVCRERRIAMVIGVTGHSDEQLTRIKEAATVIPIVKATAFSVGIQSLLAIVGPLARQLGEDYDVEIIEAHHRYKVDAPSGTALALADEIAAATGRSRDDVVFGREGAVGEKPPGQIGIHAVRMGEIVGYHEIHFSGPGETITLRHTAHSRAAFTTGALRAAAWIVGQRPALYTLRQVTS